MSIVFESIKYTIGQQFLPALVNADTTGLDEFEEAKLGEWVAHATQSWRDADDNQWGYAHMATVDNTEDEFNLCEVTGLRGATIQVMVLFNTKEY